MTGKYIYHISFENTLRRTLLYMDVGSRLAFSLVGYPHVPWYCFLMRCDICTSSVLAQSTVCHENLYRIKIVGMSKVQ
jgi:hypothetical protein